MSGELAAAWFEQRFENPWKSETAATPPRRAIWGSGIAGQIVGDNRPMFELRRLVGGRVKLYSFSFELI
jgi:hypothetical protein